jgi:hypothetical protein
VIAPGYVSNVVMVCAIEISILRCRSSLPGTSDFPFDDVLVDGKVRHSSSVTVDEETFLWLPEPRQPLASVSHAPRALEHRPLAPSPERARTLHLLSLFSPPVPTPVPTASAPPFANVDAWEHDLTEDKIECAYRLLGDIMSLIAANNGGNAFRLPHNGIREEMRADGWADI